jgi:N utilization substance protein A
MTEAQESERRQKEFGERTLRFTEALDVDEMLAQLLASEGFDTVEELAFVDQSEIAGIDGLDEETADEIHMRAREYLDRLAGEQDQRRKELGVTDELGDIEGMTPAMMVALGEAGVLNVEDLADCATDDLIGWTERVDGEAKRHAGAFSALDVLPADAEALILQARLKLGWIEAPKEAESEPESEAGSEAAGQQMASEDGAGGEAS